LPVLLQKIYWLSCCESFDAAFVAEIIVVYLSIGFSYYVYNLKSNILLCSKIYLAESLIAFDVTRALLALLLQRFSLFL
jgi:hypothetical protein